MQNRSLAKDYMFRSKIRLKIVEIFLQEKSYADVVREAQEIVELALKSLLLEYGVLFPRTYDVSNILREEKTAFPPEIQSQLERMGEISKKMRRDRELAFYGSEDLTPSEFYDQQDAVQAIAEAQEVVHGVAPFIPLAKPEAR